MAAVTIEERSKRFEEVRTQDSIDETEFLDKLDHKNITLLNSLQKIVKETVAEWHAEMTLLANELEERVFLEFLLKEFSMLCSKTMQSFSLWISNKRAKMALSYRRNMEKSSGDYAYRFLNGNQSLERLEALVAERSAIRRRESLDILLKKDEDVDKAVDDFQRLIRDTTDLFARIFERAIR